MSPDYKRQYEPKPHLTGTMKRNLLVGIVTAIGCTLSAQAQSPSQSYVISSRHLSEDPRIEESLRKSTAPVKALDRLVSIQVTAVSIESVLSSISRQSGVNFVYDNDAVPLRKRISVSQHNVSVGKVLTAMFKGSRVTAEGAGVNNVILRMSRPGDTTTKAESQTGTISGRVIDSATRAPLPNVVIHLRGSRIGAQTDNNGNYVITGVPLGETSVTARLIGYAAASATVTVGSAPATVNLTLRATPTSLAGVVTTATGEQDRLKIGNSIATINADEVVREMPIRSVTDLLEARSPGMHITHSSGEVGSGSRLRIRGARSANASNEPIVILDGIRIDAEALDNDRNPNIFGKNSRPSRLDDIDPNIIESVDILKGASASALYGSDAANGVIIIKTKRAHVGAPRTNLIFDRSRATYEAPMVPVYSAFGQTLNGYSVSCTTEVVATGGCAILDSVKTFNPWQNKWTSTFADGNDMQISANVSGGAQAVQYFLSATHLNQLGAFRVAPVNVRLYEEFHGEGTMGKKIKRPNAQTNNSITGSVSANMGQSVTALVRTTLTSRYQRRGNQGLSTIYAAASLREPDDSLSPAPGTWYIANQRSDRALRSTNGLNATWKPLSWVNTVFSYGFDFVLNEDRDFLPRNSCQPFCFNRDSLGILYYGRKQTEVHSGSMGVTVSRTFAQQFGYQLAAGGQYSKRAWSDINGFGDDISAGRSTVSNAAVKRSDEAFDETATAGWYLSPRMSWREILYVGAAIRQDAGSTLGADVKPLYPKWDVSYLISDESFFEPIANVVNTMRFRAAFGHAGLQPGSTQKLRSFSQLVRYVVPTGPTTSRLENYVQIIGPGNEDLKPERSTEFEYGGDIELFDSRLRLNLTWFKSKTKDAIMLRPLGPSVGTTTGRRENVGTITNSGFEAEIGGTMEKRGWFTYDLNVIFSRHDNIVNELGRNVLPFYVGSVIQGTSDSKVQAGYPLFGRWARPVVGFYDANNDNIIAKSEIRLGDSLIYMGRGDPKYQLSLNHSVGVLNGRVRVGMTMSYVHNFMQFNEARANASPFTYDWNHIAETPQQLQRQAYAAAQNGMTRYGFLENTNTWRINGINVQGTLPQRYASAIRASNIAVALMGSNIAMWTSYTGPDPSVNTTSSSSERTVDNGALPIPRTWGLRVSIGY